MTVRNVRAYGSRGLLPPPRLVGRTGYYGPDHVARLSLVREMLDQGYTLAAAERLISAAPGSGMQALGLFHALMSPWEDSAPELVDPRTLVRQAGVEYASDAIDRMVALGLAERTEDGMLRLENPTLVRAGLEVIGTGVPAEDVLDLVPELKSHADAVAQLFVELFRGSVWSDFVESGMPAEKWPRMQAVVETIVPLAGQALLASFQESLGHAVEVAMKEELGGPLPDQDAQA